MCNQCGKCCWQRACKDDWKMADLTEQEIESLMAVRVPHKGCMMVQDFEDKHVCLIEHLLGREKKPNACKDYDCGN